MEVDPEGRLAPETILELHGWLRDVKVTMPADPDYKAVRGVIVEVHRARSGVARIQGRIAPRLGTLKARIRKLERVLERQDAFMRDTGRGLAMTTNAESRKARIAAATEQERDELAVLEEELAVLQGLAGHVQFVRDELQAGFESASRILSSIELERRIEGLA